MNYRSVDDLNRAIIANLPHLPRDVELIVGIPRSGLLVASLLALYLNLPLTDLDGLLEGKLFKSGPRGPNGPDLAGIRNVLIVDDSIGFGFQMRDVKARLSNLSERYVFQYLAAYALKESRQDVDYIFEILPLPRIFEWNVMHHAYLERACLDIDGVICRDPTREENDDGDRYLQFVASAEPLFLPTVPVFCLVTSRLEKYRMATQEWLQRHRVQYNKLIMMDFPDKESRIRANCYGKFKADVYRKTGAILFIESSAEQAREIAQLSGKAVLCIGTRQLIDPSIGSALPVLVESAVHKARSSLKARTKRLAQQVIGKWNTA